MGEERVKLKVQGISGAGDLLGKVVTVDALVDTGASKTIVSRRVVKAAGIEVGSVPGHITGVTGRAKVPIGLAVLMAQDALVYPLDGVNANLSGLTPGAEYWLGTAGAVTDTPLDENDVANANKISQYIGKAKSATELITTDDSYVVL